MITYNLKAFFFLNLGSFSKVNKNHTLKYKIAKSYRIEIIIQPSREKMLSCWQYNVCCLKNLPGPYFSICFMKNCFQLSPYWSREGYLMVIGTPSDDALYRWNCTWLSCLSWGAFTYDVICFFGIFDLPTYPNQIHYYISLFSKIRCSLTYLPT